MARRFILAVLLAFLPAVLVGLLLGDLITEVLLETPVLICAMLIIGGVILLAVGPPQDRAQVRRRYALSATGAVLIGLCQCVAAVLPGCRVRARRSRAR
jgi:undecaprenyl-diphosphatase